MQSSPYPLVKPLWKAGIALAVFIGTLAIGNFFVGADKAVTTRSAGHDFLAFYAAGSMLRQGRAQDLYDLEAMKTLETNIAASAKLELGDGFGPFWNPPVYAWLFVPFTCFSYHTAWWIWFALNLTAAIVATAILARMLPVTWASCPCWPLVPLLVATSMPFIMALGHGQNTCISFLLLTGIVWYWRTDHATKAGVLCGLLFYKPQLAAVVATMLFFTMGRPALLGLLTSGTALLLTTLAFLPGILNDYLHELPHIVRYMQIDHRYMWERHVTLKAFWRLLLQGYDTGGLQPLASILLAASVGILAFGLTLALVRTLVFKSSNDRLIAASIASMPLLMPFYFDYDLLLVSIAIVLYAVERLRRDEVTRMDRAIVTMCIALFIWTFVNPFVAGQTHVNGSVLILSLLAGMLTCRACELPDESRTLAAERQALLAV